MPSTARRICESGWRASAAAIAALGLLEASEHDERVRMAAQPVGVRVAAARELAEETFRLGEAGLRLRDASPPRPARSSLSGSDVVRPSMMRRASSVSPISRRFAARLKWQTASRGGHGERRPSSERSPRDDASRRRLRARARSGGPGSPGKAARPRASRSSASAQRPGAGPARWPRASVARQPAFPGSCGGLATETRRAAADETVERELGARGQAFRARAAKSGSACKAPVPSIERAARHPGRSELRWTTRHCEAWPKRS